MIIQYIVLVAQRLLGEHSDGEDERFQRLVAQREPLQHYPFTRSNKVVEIDKHFNTINYQKSKEERLCILAVISKHIKEKPRN